MRSDAAEAFVERGWAVFNLPDPGIVLAVRDRLLARLRELLRVELDRLESYHTAIGEDAQLDIWDGLAASYWREGHGVEIVRRNLALAHRLVGVELCVQSHPYLRIARPGRPQDCTGLHRDTYYGASAYDVALFVPFTDLAPASALRVVSGSQMQPDTSYPFTQEQRSEVAMGSKRHRLGFPHAPQVLDPGVLDHAEPVPMVLGQALAFSLSLVHGGVENASPATGVSNDIRVVSSLAPVSWSRGVRANYYRPLRRAFVDGTFPPREAPR